MATSHKHLDELKIARFREHENQDFQATSLPMRALRYYRGLAAKYPPHIAWYYVLRRVAASLRARFGSKFSRPGAAGVVRDSVNLPSDTAQDQLIHELITRVEQGINSGKLLNSLRFAVRITGGIGDAIIAARLVRDFQSHLGNDLMFDVYFESNKAIEPFFRKIPGYRNAINIKVFDNAQKQYHFILVLNQFATFKNELIDYPALLAHKPEVLNIFSHVEEERALIDRYIHNHPFLDGAFADIAVRQGHKRYTYLHEMLGLPYGGDQLDLDIGENVPRELGLTPGRYITLHDGWDAKFKLAAMRPTKAVPLNVWTEIVKELKASRPDLTIVQLGGKTGDKIPGVDADLKGKLSFMQSAEVLAGAAVHIDAESGLVHLAATLGVRSVVMFGPTNPGWFGYPENANIPPKECGNCWWSTNTWMDVCPIGHDIPVCTSKIDAREVAADALKLIDTPANASPSSASQKADPQESLTPSHA